MEKWYKIVLIHNHIFNDIVTKKELFSNEEVLAQVNKSLNEENISNEELIGNIDVIVTINEKNINSIDINDIENNDKIHIRETYTDRGEFTEVIVVLQKISLI